ncbi:MULTISPECIES: hypothetical protein [Bacillus cereus group]|uniref:Uncharacterized protein n=2 Tax=Bacillus cereus group TaxID=86661 RepID=A0A9W7Q0L8_BACCE|nr:MULTISPECIES: hypothetical protein [Bacillus cereus group]KAA6454393.1 hypothetical protein DX932_28220 [Bacillus cereus]KAB2475449.1 hypothetical protein F8159_24190 [Bacillus cereus]KAB2506105.1 hypothetical protein F8156_01455 [Bacillus cereus]MDZ5475489.1 hypothetical protein [Bacillus thuringiensis]MRB36253.1 hypothetical protein [Bacillus thuringiensis]
MNYDEMMKKANLYHEMLEVLARPSQLIAESQKKINSLKKEIEELESDDKQQVLNKLNPKKFFFKKQESVDVEELILKKEIEIRREEKVIEKLQDTKLTEIVDLNGVVNETQKILDKKHKTVEELKSKALKVRDEYHKLVDEYEQEYLEYKRFGETVRSKVNSVKKADYVPEYHGDNGYTVEGKQLVVHAADSEVINGARKHAINRMIY